MTKLIVVLVVDRSELRTVLGFVFLDRRSAIRRFNQIAESMTDADYDVLIFDVYDTPDDIEFDEIIRNTYL